jgi:hypothetical protein
VFRARIFINAQVGSEICEIDEVSVAAIGDAS